MEIWYSVDPYDIGIVEREVTRSTAKSVFYPSPYRPGKEVCELKVSRSRRWFASWDEAHEFLIGRCMRSVEIAKTDLKEARERLAAANRLEK